MTMIEIQATVSKYTTMFDDKSSVYFAQWCSKSKLDLSQAAVERKISKATDGRKIRHRKLYVLDAKLHDDVAKGIKEYIPRYHEHLKKMKKVGCTIIGYCRKSRTIEDDETRVRLLQRMVNLMRTRSLVDKAFVSPYSAAGDEISTRDFYNKFNMASLEDVAGTTQVTPHASKPATKSAPFVTALTASQFFKAPEGNSSCFQYLYIPCKKRLPRPEIRKYLRIIGINSARVLDLAFPDHHVISLLVHDHYLPEITNRLQKTNISSLPNFDPTNPIHMGDPAYISPPPEERQKIVIHCQRNRCLCALASLHDNVKRVVACVFVSHGWLTTTDMMNTAKTH
ncbi:hypothetical protein DFQ28_001429 [Apophysomyces sp. BC1034]|nr:hypothetical protein DFQ28_001429 [Apophysomyces sp. BC1034]